MQILWGSFEQWQEVTNNQSHWENHDRESAAKVGERYTAPVQRWDSSALTSWCAADLVRDAKIKIPAPYGDHAHFSGRKKPMEQANRRIPDSPRLQFDSWGCSWQVVVLVVFRKSHFQLGAAVQDRDGIQKQSLGIRRLRPTSDSPGRR